MKRFLTCVDPDANVDKFWKIDYTPGSSQYTYSYGRNKTRESGPNGRNKTRGSGPKVKTFPSPEAAEKAAKKALNDKLGAGYVDLPGTNLTILNATSPAPTTTRPFKPMLFNSIEPDCTPGRNFGRRYAKALLEALAPFIVNDQCAIEEKVNGDRIAIIGRNGKITVVGKNGQVSKSGPLFSDRRFAPVLARLLAMFGDFILDGELIAGRLVLFDLPRLVCGWVTFDGSEEWYKRRAALEQIFAAWNPNPKLFALLPYAQGAEAKQALVDRCRDELREGVMVKDINAPYKCGPRRGSGGYKAKNWKSASLIVDEVNIDGKCNATLVAWKGGKLVPVGGCSLNGKGNISQLHADAIAAGRRLVIEVKYLYWDKEALVQTDCLGVRDDVDESECLFDQLVGTNKSVICR